MFIFQDKNNQYLNQEVDLRLSELTAQGLIKSEDEYKKVIEDTLSNVDATLQRLTDVKKYIVKKDDVVSSTQLNNLFTDLTADIRILHKEMSDVHRVIDLTFERNQLFYRRIKNRIASIWKEIQHFRENSFNIESSTYTFFESFNEDSVMHLTGLTVDKKTGTLVLTPGYVNSFSDSSEVANVDVTVYPAANKDGGLVDTTNPRNTFEYNYSKGDRTLLKDGLWKIQMLAADIPEVMFDPIGRGSTQSYRGLLAQVDITFVSQKLINEINIDPYGDFSTKVLSMNYLSDENDSTWKNVVDENGNIVTNADVDWIVFRNFVPFTAKTLRLNFYQPNFQNISRLLTQVDKMLDKMVTALIEQRFDKINYSYKTVDQFPRYDASDEADIYDEVMNVIEEGGDISTLESQITDILVPKPINIQADITNWKLYNLGAWSIDPRNVGYNPQSEGIYISHDPRDRTSGFKMTNGSPMYAKLYTKQSEVSSSSIEWSLLADVDGVNYVEIPIIPNNDLQRNEAINYGEYPILKYSTRRNNLNYSNLNNIFKLDFPIHPMYQSLVIIMENGIEYTLDNLENFDIYNSTELYFPTVNLSNGSIYSIKYVPAVIDTVKCWSIIPDQQPANGLIDFGNMCVFATKAAALDMIQLLSTSSSEKPYYINVAKSYNVSFQLCTKKEYDIWFQGGTTNTFVDSAADGDTDHTNLSSWFSNNKPYQYNSKETKATWLYKESIGIPYTENSEEYNTWNALPSAVPSMKTKRKQY